VLPADHCGVRKVLRGIRIAAFAFAGLLLCLLISRVLTVDPPRHQNNTILDEASGTQPNVPPPPALPESKTTQPAKESPGPVKLSKPQAPVRRAQVVSEQPVPAGPNQVILSGDVQVSGAEDASAASPVTETASLDEPKGPVIVVAPGGKEEHRAVRLLKGMGHALGIGRPKDPAEEAFR
jgi:hypothetical protein